MRDRVLPSAIFYRILILSESHTDADAQQSARTAERSQGLRVRAFQGNTWANLHETSTLPLSAQQIPTLYTDNIPSPVALRSFDLGVSSCSLSRYRPT